MPKRKRGRIRPKTEAIATTGPERKRKRRRRTGSVASNPEANPGGPKRTPRLSEAEKREGARKRRNRVAAPYSEQADTDREYQRLADDEVKRSSAVVRATPRDDFYRAREARAAARRRRKAARAGDQDRGRAFDQAKTPLTAKRRKRKN